MTRPRSPDLAASIRDRLRRHAAATSVDFQQVLDQYALERLLHRLARSPHADAFVLKGALLFSAWDGAPHRRTRDADLLGAGEASADGLVATFQDVVAAQPEVEDGLLFDRTSIRATPLQEVTTHPGFRVTFRATLAGARAGLQIDVAFGQVMVPGPRLIELPALLDMPRPRLRAYPVESVMAEKLEAMVRFGLRNSRLKDYFDLWFILTRLSHDPGIVARAVAATFGRRGTALPAATPAGLTDAYADDDRKRQWRAFLDRTAATERPDLREVMTIIERKMMPIVMQARTVVVDA